MTFLRSVLVATLLAISTNIGQFAVQKASAADLSDYWARYVVGLRGCDKND